MRNWKVGGRKCFPVEFHTLKGKTLTKVKVKGGNDDTEIYFHVGKEKFVLTHIQECCEDVSLIDVVGDFSDLIGNPLITAEVRTSDYEPSSERRYGTWAFYEMSTIKGSVTMRWLGMSSGAYSQEAELYMLLPEESKQS